MSMLDVSDDELSRMERMPLATASELVTWNLSVGKIDLGGATVDDVVTVRWEDAIEVASIYLRQLGFDEQVVKHAIGSSASSRKELSFHTRRRLFDIHRIRLMLVILYPEQLQRQKAWLSSSFGNKKTAIEMIVEGEGYVIRQMLEKRVAT